MASYSVRLLGCKVSQTTRLHVFPSSPRPGTANGEADPVTEGILAA